MGAVVRNINYNIALLFVVFSLRLSNDIVGQSSSQIHRDFKLWLTKIELTDGKIVYGFVDQIHRSSISILDDLTYLSDPIPTTIEASQIQSITYYHYGDFSNAFMGTLIPITAVAAAAAMPEIDYWGGVIVAGAILYGTPFAAVLGGISSTQSKQKKFEIGGSTIDFENHLSNIKIKTPLPVAHLRLTEKGKRWYREVTGQLSYYPITHKPVLHFYLGAGQTINTSPSDRENFISQFEQSYNYQRNMPTGLGGMGISFGNKFEAGFTINSGTYADQQWELVDGEYNYYYYEYADTDLTTFYILYHMLPYDPITKPFQASLGTGLSYYSGYYSQDISVTNTATQAQTSASNGDNLNQLGVSFIARGEAFLSSRYSIVLQADYNLNVSGYSNEVALQSPHRTDPISSQFNISSLTISTGIRLHY